MGFKPVFSCQVIKSRSSPGTNTPFLAGHIKLESSPLENTNYFNPCPITKSDCVSHTSQLRTVVLHDEV